MDAANPDRSPDSLPSALLVKTTLSTRSGRVSASRMRAVGAVSDAERDLHRARLLEQRLGVGDAGRQVIRALLARAAEPARS